MAVDKKLAVFFMAVVTVSVSLIAYFAESSIHSLDQAVIERRNFDAQNIAEDVSNLLNNTKDILQGSAYLPQVYNVPHSQSIDPSMHGIPEETDLPKRGIAHEILNQDDSVETVGFLLPNGDVYMIEPYEQQLRITSSNFAFRDYYKGPISTNQPYLSDVFKSQASGHDVSVISIPVHSENGTLTGVWLGAMNLAQIVAKLNSEYHSETGLIVILDNNGNVAAKSEGYGPANSAAIQGLDVYKSALNGQPGSLVTEVDGTKMLVSHHPIKTFSGTWTMFILKPYEDSFYASTATRNIEVVSIASLIIVSAVFAVVVRKS
ncbi:MAG TPA: cache domain-containing protein [Candidatus Nitrosotenuis sp.]|nr:cache domain-containing protein [Candidatus Nitrosotenuis sp.]